MKELLAVYLQSGLFGSIIIVLILLMRCFLKKAPRMILCVLWLLAAARLVLPFNLESQLSLQPSYDPAQLTAHMAIQSEDPAPLPQWTLIAPADPLPQEAPSAPVTAPVSGDAVQPAAALDHMQLLSLIWLVVGGVLVLYAGISYAALRCKVREAVMLDPQVMESERIGGAFLLGYFKPIIYVPVGLDPHDRRFILAHERAHIARGDNWWKLAGYLCCCIHWYNPLVWLGYVLLCRDIEIACDQRVIQDLDLDDRKAYSFALLNCGKRLSGYLAYPVAFGEVSLKQRIKHVLTYRCPSQWVTIIGVVAVVFVSVCFLTSPISDAVSLPINTEPAATESTTLSTTVPAETDFQTEATAATTAPTLPATTPTMPVPTAPHTTTPEKPSPTEPSAPAPTAPPATVPEEVPDSGTGILDSGSWDTWDDSPVTWQVSTDGTLTISGIGTLHGSSDYPWQSYSHLITRVVIDDGITGLP